MVSVRPVYEPQHFAIQQVGIVHECHYAKKMGLPGLSRKHRMASKEQVRLSHRAPPNHSTLRQSCEIIVVKNLRAWRVGRKRVLC